MENTFVYSNSPILPAISVVMAVYNEAEHIEEAIDSILAQTFTNFEFIIVDDASTDNTRCIVEDYALKDKRIRVFLNAKNQKLAASLNLGIAEARASLIARMDADDWSHPERLAKQYAFMQEHPQIDVCGTNMIYCGAWSGISQWPERHDAIITQLLFSTALAHPSIIMRKSMAAVGYNPRYIKAQDYELWSRLAFEHGARFHNIQEVLVRYRADPSQGWESFFNKILDMNLRYVGIAPTERELALHSMLALGGVGQVLHEFNAHEALGWLVKILETCKKSQKVSLQILQTKMLLYATQILWHSKNIRLLHMYRRLFADILTYNRIFLWRISMSLVNTLGRKIMNRLPYALRTTFELWKNISINKRHYASAGRWEAIGENDEPIPWYSYPCTDFLSQFSFENKIIFEYGCGNSTIFWGKRAKCVISVESDSEWHDKMKKIIPENCKLIFCNDESYPTKISEVSDKVDVICIDGRFRNRCIKAALPHLNEGGLIILDNSDWHQISTSELRSLGFTQIDFIGFAPITSFTSATSIFFKNSFALNLQNIVRPGSLHCGVKGFEDTKK